MNPVPAPQFARRAYPSNDSTIANLHSNTIDEYYTPLNDFLNEWVYPVLTEGQGGQLSALIAITQNRLRIELEISRFLSQTLSHHRD